MKSKIMKLLICIYIVYCLVYYFMQIRLSVQKAVSIWANTIIPSVFPYIVLSNYLCNTDVFDLFEVFPGKYIAKAFNLSFCSTRAVLCSLFCGYPVGAICTRYLYEKKQIDKTEAKRLVCFTNNAGPLFLISAVGGGLLNDATKGFVIYIVQIVSAIIYGCIASVGQNTKKPCAKNIKKTKTDFCALIKESVTTTVNICGFMIVAFVLAECCLISLFKIMPYQTNTNFIVTFVNGMFEISAGVTAAANLRYSSYAFGIICAIVSWSGLSVIMQIKSIAGNIISVKDIIFAKAVQAVMGFALGYMYDRLCNYKLEIISIENTMIKVSLILSVIIFSYYIFFKKKKLSD